MANSSSSRSLSSAFKRLKLSPSTPTVQHQIRHLHQSSRKHAPSPSKAASAQAMKPSQEQEMANLRLPKAVQATYLAPLKRQPPEGATTSAQLQLRSYSVRNLEVFADFAMRAAYFLNLPANGPRPLRRITERWTLPRSNFVHKKSQETFERITLKRLIEIKGGHPETVAIWLAFLRKHQYYGVGMKANVYDYGGVETGKDLETEAAKIKKLMGNPKETFETFAGVKRMKKTEPVFRAPFKDSWGAKAAHGAVPFQHNVSNALHIDHIREAMNEAQGKTEGSE